ncbi:MAG: hypothetical protein H6Q37_2235 [Chloroflexi bacterium]|nr:hypothetical protein [Chloroflexota bacterium]
MRPRYLVIFRFCLILLAAFSINAPIRAAYSQEANTVWGNKPVLAHYLLEPDSAKLLQNDLGLSPGELQRIIHIAQVEGSQIQRLEVESESVIGDPNLTREQKSSWVVQSGYNQKIQSILRADGQRLLGMLGPDLYRRLVDWIEARWTQERKQLNRQGGSTKVLAMLAQKTYPRSFEVYATRYDAGDRKIVALPDKCVKFANGGAMQCPGYAYGQGYSVAISYKGNLVVALVEESGPWNVDDNYWSKTSDPQPRRKFADLGLGVPEAQAAYFNGYNGGADQFGRTVTSPVAIDISKALAADLGLGPGNNQVTVTFLWTDGWDAPVAKPGKGKTQPAQTAAPPATGWEIATPDADGSIVHVVKSGQTLVGISTVYKIPLADLLALNGLTMQSIIQPGDRIVVKQADPTRTATTTPTSEPTSTKAPIARTPLPPTASISATVLITPQPTATTPPVISGSFSPQNAILASIVFLGLVGVVLLAWGIIIRRNR